MVFHVRDPKADALVRELAQRRGQGITETIREVFEEALEREKRQARWKADELRERLQPLFDRIDAYPRTGPAADKRFFDEMWGEEGND